LTARLDRLHNHNLQYSHWIATWSCCKSALFSIFRLGIVRHLLLRLQSSCSTTSSSCPSGDSASTSSASCCTSTCRNTATPARSWYATSSSTDSRSSRCWCGCLGILKFGRDLAAGRVLHERCVGRKEGSFHILWSLAPVEVRRAKINVVLWPLERVRNRCLYAHQPSVLLYSYHTTHDAVPQESPRRKHSCSCRTENPQSSPRSVLSSHASIAAVRSSVRDRPWRRSALRIHLGGPRAHSRTRLRHARAAHCRAMNCVRTVEGAVGRLSKSQYQ
jgi:hypothetical protein